MKDLKVSAARQPNNKPWCVVSCAKMVLDYWGYSISQKKIVEATRMKQSGLMPQDIGRVLLSPKFGLDVTLLFWIRGMEPRFHGQVLTEESIINDFAQSQLSRTASQFDKKFWPSWVSSVLRFVKAGGRVLLKGPYVEDIIGELEHKRPPIIFFSPQLLAESGAFDYGHSVVPIGVTALKTGAAQYSVKYLDPGSGKPRIASLSHMVQACHIWQGAALFIRKHESKESHLIND